MNKYETVSSALSFALAIYFAQLLADGNWQDETRMKTIQLTIDAIKVLDQKRMFPVGGIVSKGSPMGIKMGEGERVISRSHWPKVE